MSATTIPAKVLRAAAEAKDATDRATKIEKENAVLLERAATLEARNAELANALKTAEAGRIEASGRHGRLTVECANLPAADNPKTSANTGLSMAHELLRGSAPIVI